MFDLPKSTEIRKPVHKKLIYSKFATELSGDKKERFDADISRIIIINEISEISVNIKAAEKVSSIFVAQVELKTKDYNDRNIILISKLFGQNLLIVLHYEEQYQLAIYETKLLKSEWNNEEDFSLKLNGLDMGTVWDNFVMQVSGISVEIGNTLVEQISLESEKEKLRKQIDDLERKARKETQSKKKFELFQQIKKYKNRLEEA
ncbi:DUF4391 domain-containing protein [Lachnospiraceae bacterium MD1]|uniref:DUF4391 domain-containing protein n=1 Tax=Variimorphobacter saccharofermentans TaxID=2755051 RepID=A0A839K012_9FIRM|nr:DUF4391 domain-containing protein [Variimorphobacter saccharofermentans]MBB2182777.1 DUF4391 domain-containing protein [Variimorphobacter saccharofermentans]